MATLVIVTVSVLLRSTERHLILLWKNQEGFLEEKSFWKAFGERQKLNVSISLTQVTTGLEVISKFFFAVDIFYWVLEGIASESSRKAHFGFKNHTAKVAQGVAGRIRG